ncbi:TPA_asm: polyprotein [Leucanthemum virus 1]|uniref:Replicase n=1 Tax=Leucanthemum virus 1 TaxID=2977970 RepID=A0A9N6YIW8_9RHAB|nr:TPA_asm: polyprotein [Leucanthemum virus 1]
MSVDEETYNSVLGINEDEDLDEKTMLDLHLGNAINLDIVEFLLTGSFNKYKLFVAGFQKDLWREILPFQNKDEDIHIGLLKCTQTVLLKRSMKANMPYNLFRDLTKIIAKSLKARDIIIPIVEYEEEIVNTKMHVNALHLELFRFALKVICMSSEAWREGGKTFYSGLRIYDKTVYGRFRNHGIDWKVKCNNQFCTIYDCLTEEEHVGTFDSFLLLMDTLGQRLCLEIGIIISSAANVEGTPVLEDVMGVIETGDLVLKRYGNNGYEFIALFESIIVSVILRKNPDLVTDNQKFFDNCRFELEEMIVEGIFDKGIMVYFDAMTGFLIELPDEVLSNVFCIYRIWGHPRVNILEGMEKVMKKGTAIKLPSIEIAEVIKIQFKKMFVMNYYDKHHTYPNLEYINDKRSYLQDCLEIGSPISMSHQNYSFYDWNFVRLKQMWTIPVTYDIFHILNDKAVSPTRSELHQSVKKGAGTYLGAQRRGLVRWLTGRSIKCKEFLDEIEDNGLDEDSLIIGMYEKEREIKIKARMFSLMSERMRMYFVLTEELIAEHILKYFPQITMKDPLHVQIKKLWAVSGSSYEESLDPVINIDFEKWNLNFRDELTRPIFSEMDNLFGYTNLIARTHDIFYNSYIYSSSGKYLPKVSPTGLIIDPPMSYTHHAGGFEGLRQKGWTVATVCLLCYLTDISKISMNLLGQGDNQVIRLYMPHNYWNNLNMSKDQKIIAAKEKLNKFMRDMDSHFGQAGLPIKMRETWTSTRLCMYGKNMYLDGKCMPQWLKKLLRTYAMSNEGTLTISGVIGTLATNMNAAAHASTSPDIMYVIYMFLAEWSLEFLFAYHPFTRSSITNGSEIEILMPSRHGRKKISSGFINLHRLAVTIITIPTSVGGSITIPMTSFIMRGFPDHGSEGYAWLKLLSSVDSPWRSMFQNWYSFIPNETIEFDMLVQSPWSINHKKPPTPGLQSREVVRDWLLSGQFDKNVFIKNVKSIMGGFDRKRVSRMFCTEEINPLILNELYNTFPQVYLDSVLRRVENTRTIKKMAMSMGNRAPIVSALMELETSFIGYLYWRGNNKGKVFSECATEQCRNARNKGWGRIIKGLTTPHPLEYAFDMQCTSINTRCDGSDYIYARIDPQGSFPPYLGSKVKTKVMSMQDPSARTEPLVTISSKLAKLAPWLKLGPNTLKLIERNVSVVCNTEIFDNFFDEEHTFFSGSVEHRYNPACSSEGCFINYSPQIGSKVFMSTDNMPRYGKGQQNVTMNFQALFCMIQYCSARRYDTTCLHYHLRCESCIREVDDKLTDIEDFTDLLESVYNESTLKELSETLGFLSENYSRNLETPKESSSFLHLKGSGTLNSRSLNDGVTWLLALKAAKMIMCAQDSSTTMINQEDLQSFPRVYSYKVSSDKVLEYCVMCCITIKHTRMYKKNENTDFDRVKGKLKSQLLKTTVDKFKGIASLCIGRTFDSSQGEKAVYYNTGEFPETVVGFTTAIRSEIVSKVDDMTGFSNDHRKWIIPVAGVSLSDQVLLVKVRLLSREHCGDCIHSLTLIANDRSSYIDCGQGHLNKEMMKCKGILMPLDAVMKGFDLKRTRITPRLSMEGYGFASILSWCYPIEYRNSSLIAKIDCDATLKNFLIENESVVLPTRAGYKWDLMISLIQEKAYENVIVLGDGTGFTSAICARRFPSAAIYPSGLLETGKMIPQDLQSIKPFVSRVYTNVNSALLENVADDITNQKWLPEFTNFLTHLRGRTLVISDIEGRGLLERTVERVLSTLLSMDNVDLVFKVYFRTFETDLTVYKYSNWMCNLRYQEGFVSNLKITLRKLMPRESSFTEISTKSAPVNVLKDWLDLFHNTYDELLNVSIKIALNSLHRNLIPVEKKEMLYPREVILVRLLTYLSTNFKVPYTGMAPNDNRKLLDGTLCRIIRGVKMVLLALYGCKIKNMEFYRNLGLAKADTDIRYKQLRDFQLLFIEWEREIHITDKEERAANVLRTIYLCSRGVKDDGSVPESLNELYLKDIIPANIFWKRARGALV